MSGIPRKRLFLYLLAAAALLAANLMRVGTQSPEPEAVATAARVPAAQVETLYASRDFEAPAIRAERDLFRRPPERATAPEPAPAAAPAPPKPPDPLQIARGQAAEVLGGIKLLGVMKGGDRLLAVLEHDGRTQSLAEGEEVLPNFRVDAISTNDVRIMNDRLGLTGVVILGGGEPTRILGMGE